MTYGYYNLTLMVEVPPVVPNIINPTQADLAAANIFPITVLTDAPAGCQLSHYTYALNSDGASVTKTAVYLTAAQVAANRTAEIVAHVTADGFWPMAKLFATTLEKYFPGMTPPAEQNPALTFPQVLGYFAQIQAAGTETAVTVGDSEFLAMVYQQICNYTGSTSTCDFPWSSMPQS